MRQSEQQKLLAFFFLTTHPTGTDNYGLDREEAELFLVSLCWRIKPLPWPFGWCLETFSFSCGISCSPPDAASGRLLTSGHLQPFAMTESPLQILWGDAPTSMERAHRSRWATSIHMPGPSIHYRKFPPHLLAGCLSPSKFSISGKIYSTPRSKLSRESIC